MVVVVVCCEQLEKPREVLEVFHPGVEVGVERTSARVGGGKEQCCCFYLFKAHFIY